MTDRIAKGTPGDQEASAEAIHALVVLGVFDAYLRSTGKTTVPLDVRGILPYLESPDCHPSLPSALLYVRPFPQDVALQLVPHAARRDALALGMARVIATAGGEGRRRLVHMVVGRSNSPGAAPRGLESMQLGDREATQIIRYLESGPPARRRLLALMAIAGSSRPTSPWIPRVEPFLKDRSPLVRGLAAKVLRGGGDRSRHLFPKLMPLLSFDEMYSAEARAAEWAAEGIERLSPGPEWAPQILALVRNDDSLPRIREAAMRVLAKMGEATARDAISAVEYRIQNEQDSVEAETARAVLRQLQEIVKATHSESGSQE